MNDYLNIIKRSALKKRAFFSKDDIKWCSVPIPPIDDHKGAEFNFSDEQISKYGQSQTHPSIVYAPNGWNGHKYWLVTTPYPSAVGVFENPCVYYGDEDADGNPPVLFHPISGGTASDNYPIITNPVVKVKTTSAVNSDPDVWIDSATGKMCIISRDNTRGFSWLYQESIDGLSWSERTEYPNDLINIHDDGGIAHELVSPSVLDNGDGTATLYGLCGLGYYTGANSSMERNRLCRKGMFVYKGIPSQGKGGISLQYHASLLGAPSIYPWHMDIAKHKDKYYMVFCGFDIHASTGLSLFMAISDDGYDFQVSPIPIEDSILHYRPSIAFRDDELLIYGSSEGGGVPTDENAYPRGASDIPVDGRSIFLLKANIYKLVDYLFETIEIR